MHLLKSSEVEAKQLPKTRRPSKFMLAPLPGKTGETFSLALLNSLMREQLRLGDEGVSARIERGKEGSSSGRDGGEGGYRDIETRAQTKAVDSDKTAVTAPVSLASSPHTDASVTLQLAVLRHLVPPPWTRKSKHQPVGGNPRGLISGLTEEPEAASGSGGAMAAEEDDDEDDGRSERVSEVGGRKRFRQDWMPKPWDVDRSLSHLIAGGVGGKSIAPHSGRRPSQSWPGGESKDWEVHHLALLTTTFKPDIMRRMGENDGDLTRIWKRSYSRVLLSNQSAMAGELKVSGVPASWKGEVGTEGEEDGGGGKDKLVLRYKDKVVDEISLQKPYG